MAGFWDDRYKIEGKIWGDAPSPTVLSAIDLFKKEHVRNILVPGSGYGRNAAAFHRAGFEVTGIEESETAVDLASQSDPGIHYCCGSVLDMPFDGSIFDGVYCFNVLHLLRSIDREKFIRLCGEQLRENGILYYVVFSEKDESYGRGREVEPSTFESKPGREVHYFTSEDLKRTFHDFEILKTGLVEEPEDHGEEGKHVHMLRWIAARKRPHSGYKR